VVRGLPVGARSFRCLRRHPRAFELAAGRRRGGRDAGNPLACRCSASPGLRYRLGFFLRLCHVTASIWLLRSFGPATAACRLLARGYAILRRQHALDLGDERVWQAGLRDEGIASGLACALGVPRERMTG
jgi:hypothetical protein